MLSVVNKGITPENELQIQRDSALRVQKKSESQVGEAMDLLLIRTNWEDKEATARLASSLAECSDVFVDLWAARAKEVINRNGSKKSKISSSIESFMADVLQKVSFERSQKIVHIMGSDPREAVLLEQASHKPSACGDPNHNHGNDGKVKSHDKSDVKKKNTRAYSWNLIGNLIEGFSETGLAFLSGSFVAKIKAAHFFGDSGSSGVSVAQSKYFPNISAKTDASIALGKSGTLLVNALWPFATLILNGPLASFTSKVALLSVAGAILGGVINTGILVNTVRNISKSGQRLGEIWHAVYDLVSEGASAVVAGAMVASIHLGAAPESVTWLDSSLMGCLAAFGVYGTSKLGRPGLAVLRETKPPVVKRNDYKALPKKVESFLLEKDPTENNFEENPVRIELTQASVSEATARIGTFWPLFEKLSDDKKQLESLALGVAALITEETGVPVTKLEDFYGKTIYKAGEHHHHGDSCSSSSAPTDVASNSTADASCSGSSSSCSSVSTTTSDHPTKSGNILTKVFATAGPLVGKATKRIGTSKSSEFAVQQTCGSSESSNTAMSGLRN